MPILVRHEGDWTGTYTIVDTAGKVIDRYESHLTCQFPENSSHSYYQINRYKWSDGKREEYEFPGIYKDKALWFDTDRIDGKAWETGNSTIILWFTYKTAPEMELYEMIQISADNNHRARTWHWFKNQQIYQRTLIQEERLR
jgi:hypothetical protein